MKSSAQTKDGAIDNLLRAYVSRPSNPQQVCPDFDADQANAYIESGLTGSSRTRYEQHLSQCPPCRKSVVALMRLSEADRPAAVSAVREPVGAGGSWLDGVRRMLGALAQPRWAMAAAAIIVAAISLPLILTRNEVRQTASPIADQVASIPDARSVAAASPDAQNTQAETAAPSLESARQRENSAEKSQLMAKNQPVPTATEAAAGAAGADLSKKLAETSSAAEPVDELKRKSESQAAAAPPTAGAAPGSQVARVDSDQNRQQQQTKDAGQQQTGDAKTVARAEEDRSKERNERAEEVAQPPAPRAPAESARGRSGFRRALRDANTEAVKPEERKFNGKKFLFKDGAWTDKDFDPDKDLPTVTIIRDSNVYSEVLNKRPGLKPFLTGFHASERAIIVYKGTVYKLIPQ